MVDQHRHITDEHTQNKDKIFVQTESKLWTKPKMMSLDKIIDIVDDELNINVNAVIFNKEDITQNLPPDTMSLDVSAHIAVDTNYLYVWVPQTKRWKRIPLSEW